MADPGLAEPLIEPLTEVLTSCVPGFTQLLSVDRLSGGASQETYRLVLERDAGPLQLALRRAPGGGGLIERPQHYPGLAVEAELMRAAAEVGVPAPEIVHVLAPAEGLGEGFIMQWLDGETLGGRIARSSKYARLREHLAYDCGRILAKIHAIDLDETGLRESLQVTEPAEFVEQTWARYRELPTPQPMIDYSARWLLRNLPQQRLEALVHNDFRNGNLMVDNDAVVAVLDWEIAHIGDPMRDLGWICTNSWRFGVSEAAVGGFGTRAELFRGYADQSGVEVDSQRVKFWEVFGSFWWAVGCLGMAEHYRTGPDQTVERPAIGRRSSECQIDCVNLLIPGPAPLLDASLLNDKGQVDAPAEATQSYQMPRQDELLRSVREFLRDEVMPSTTGRTQFLARVAANSLAIVDRELRVGEALIDLELRLLQGLELDTPAQDNVAALRWALVDVLRGETTLVQPLDEELLARYLRESVINQLAIDQPGYSGLKVALANHHPAPRE